MKMRFFKNIILVFTLSLSLVLSVYSRTAIDWFERGCKANKHEKKEKYFTQALKINPKFILAYRNRGLAREEREDFEGAFKDYTKIIEIKPGYYMAYALRANLLQKMGHEKDAQKDLQKAVDLNPNDTNLKDMMAKLQKTGKPEKKQKKSSDEKRAIPKVPSKVQYNSKKKHDSVDLKKGGSVQKKKVSNLSEPEFSKSDKNLYFNKGRDAKQRGEAAMALQYFTEAIKIDAEFSEAYFERGNLKIDRGDYNDAIIDFNKAIEINGNKAIYYSRRGKAKKYDGDSDAAVKDYKKAISIDPEITDAWFNLGWIRYNYGDFNGAIDCFNKAITIDSKMAAAYNARGWVKEDMGDEDGAEKDFLTYKKLTGF